METQELIDMLSELAQVDIDTIHSYQQALDQISDDIIRDRLAMFRDEHRRHFETISDAISALGGQAPEMSKDFKGYVIVAFTALRKATGMQGALKALRTTEEITNRYYSRVIPNEVPETISTLLHQHFSDERNHLEYINKNIQALSKGTAPT